MGKRKSRPSGDRDRAPDGVAPAGPRGYHTPVMLKEVLAYLPHRPHGVFIDVTLGGGGHAEAMLEKLGPTGMVIGVDQDLEALRATDRLQKRYPERLKRVEGNFEELPEILETLGLKGVDGVLADLGVSSRHLDEADRGFSFLRDGPLDMRMGPSAKLSAGELLNTAPAEELQRIFRELGEEPRAARGARAIVEARDREEIATTGRLAEVIERAFGRRGRKHPATRIFQALRMAVNRELEVLEKLVGALPGLLNPGGRAAVITYHSLEDRMVKRAFKEAEPHCLCPPQALLCECGMPGIMRVLTRKVVKPSREEVEANPRARSAKLRVAERI